MIHIALRWSAGGGSLFYRHTAPLGRKAGVDSSIEIRQYVSDSEDASGT